MGVLFEKLSHKRSGLTRTRSGHVVVLGGGLERFSPPVGVFRFVEWQQTGDNVSAAFVYKRDVGEVPLGIANAHVRQVAKPGSKLEAHSLDRDR